MSSPTYDTTLDAVDHLGATPDGSVPLRLDDDRIGPNTEVVLPDGAFAFTGRATTESGALRFRAAPDASPVLRPPEGHNEFLASVNCDYFAFEGIDVDVSGGVTGMRVKADSFDVTDVTFRGRGTHPNWSVTNCFSLHVTDPQGEGTVRNVTALRGSGWARYKNGNGRAFMWVGPEHVGTLRVRNCRVSEFGNNGVYGSAAAGRIVVEDSAFWNNNVASVRFGSDGCEMRNTTVGIDVERYTGPRESRFEADDFYLRGVWVEAKQAALDAPGRVRVADSTLVVRDAPTTRAAVIVRPNAGALSVREGTIIDVRGGPSPAIEAKRPSTVGPGSRRHRPPDPPYDLALDTVRLSGSGSAAAAVTAAGRDVAARRTLVTFDDDRDGVRVTDGNCTLMDCHVGVGGQPAVVEVSNRHVPGEPPTVNPRLVRRNVSTRTDAATWAALLADRADDDRRDPARIAIVADGDPAAYRLVAATGATLEAADGTVEDTTAADWTAAGEVAAGDRAVYRLRGALVSATFSGGAAVTVDGVPVDRGALVAATRRRETERMAAVLDRE
ncbi:hypothetical protein [Candidatus Halobonum tyrrellensis]|uniref:Right handed beta helix domain-containing protein n=1 Tax=Candidatus Halobonum tyrrellensis G22 TaxID=1324957 RepID=V4HE09_9EURY|nr:hypothetical protein [Candidatus Halobonum tyrrellensis]ESP88288.1 hypothetical protein K933_09202 [Candidatus Halobonum tyrrellensis G22]